MYRGLFLFVLVLLLHSLLFVENHFSQSERFRCYLKKLVIGYELHALLKAEHCRRNEAERVIRTRGTGVGEMLRLADIADNILVLGALADYHALIDFHTRADKEGDWGLGIGPNPQSPIPNPQSPIPNN